MMQPDLLAALRPIVATLDDLGVEYCVVGSLASSTHGVARASIDADIVARLGVEQVTPLVSAIDHAYYVSEDAALDAVRRRSMFNVVHLATMLKVDVYVLTDRPFDQVSFSRRRPHALEASAEATYALASPEDTVVHKLEWYRLGREVSDRQWADIVGVLRVQGESLDQSYMRKWADAQGVADLLDRAFREVAEGVD